MTTALPLVRGEDTDQDCGVAIVQEYRRRPAAPDLRPWIAGYSGYRQAGAPPMRHRGLPSPWMTVIVALHEPLQVAEHPDPAQTPGDFWTLVGGLHTAPALLVHDGRQSGVQIALHPLAARAVLGIPAGQLLAVDVTGETLLGDAVTHLQEELRNTPDWSARFGRLDEFFRRRLNAADLLIDPLLQYLCAQLARGVPVGALAAEVGWSQRHLLNRVRADVGLSPRTFARVARFDRVRRALASARYRPLAEAADAFGYFDQAHLTREFTAFAGISPRRWLAAEFRFVQDGDESSEETARHDSNQ